MAYSLGRPLKTLGHKTAVVLHGWSEETLASPFILKVTQILVPIQRGLDGLKKLIVFF